MDTNESFLLIDDERDMTVDRVCRTYDEGLAALQEKCWTHAYFDHDLGNPDPAKTGYDLCCFLERNPQHRPLNVYLVTSNPVGRDRMGEALVAAGYFRVNSVHYRLQ